MSTAKPTLGYPSRSAAVAALRQQNKTTREIAAAIGIPEKTVLSLEYSFARRQRLGNRDARPSELLGRTIVFPRDILDALAPHAAKRGIHPNSLARRIVETVVEEKMVDAVLDDIEEDPFADARRA